jgi:hypothetical protein
MLKTPTPSMTRKKKNLTKMKKMKSNKKIKLLRVASFRL